MKFVHVQLSGALCIAAMTASAPALAQNWMYQSGPMGSPPAAYQGYDPTAPLQYNSGPYQTYSAPVPTGTPSDAGMGAYGNQYFRMAPPPRPCVLATGDGC